MNLRDNEGQTCLHALYMNRSLAAKCDDERSTILQRILSLAEPSLVNVQDECGNSAMHYACQHYVVKSVKCLLEAGADTNVRNEAGNTPLHKFLSRREPCIIVVACFIAHHDSDLPITNTARRRALSKVWKSTKQYKLLTDAKRIRDRIRNTGVLLQNIS